LISSWNASAADRFEAKPSAPANIRKTAKNAETRDLDKRKFEAGIFISLISLFEEISFSPVLFAE